MAVPASLNGQLQRHLLLRKLLAAGMASCQGAVHERIAARGLCPVPRIIRQCHYYQLLAFRIGKLYS